MLHFIITLELSLGSRIRRIPKWSTYLLYLCLSLQPSFKPDLWPFWPSYTSVLCLPFWLLWKPYLYLHFDSRPNWVLVYHFGWRENRIYVHLLVLKRDMFAINNLKLSIYRKKHFRSFIQFISTAPRTILTHGPLLLIFFLFWWIPITIRWKKSLFYCVTVE